ADMSEAMREVLVDGMRQVQQRLAQTIVIGQHDGSLSTSLQPEPLAESLYQLWVGAELLTKVQRSPAPLQRALQQTELWLQGPG
ncbi:MAG: TetR family transcriptional regulator C-terminal domain-containing protein, partial [Perlucidibaca sp.]